MFTSTGFLSSIPLLYTVLGLQTRGWEGWSASTDVTFKSDSRTSSIKLQHPFDRVLIPVGVRGQTYPMILDTGSTISWFFTQRTPEAVRQDNAFYPVRKEEFVPDAAFFQLYGGMDWCGGDVFQADIELGDLTVEDQALGTADLVTSAFAEETSGMFGLAFPYWNTVIGANNASVLERVMGGLNEPVFTTSIKPACANDSFIDFGFIDQTKYKGDIKYVDAEPGAGWWGLNFTASTGNTTAPGAGIIDTGTPSVSVPDDVYNEYYRNIGVQGYDLGTQRPVIPCNATLPDLTLQFGEYKVTLGNKLLKAYQGDGRCTGYITKEVLPGMSVLGLPFYESSFVVHKPNFGSQPQLGFAQHA